MPVRTGTISEPQQGWEWKWAEPAWISLTKTRLDGGLVFKAQVVEIVPIFAESLTEPLPRIVDKDGTIYVMRGELTVIRAILDGKSGFEALVIRA